MTAKNDLFGVISKINTKKRDHWAEMDEKDQKAFSFFMAIRWLYGTKDRAQIFFLNEFVNPFAFLFTLKHFDHRELLYDLLTCCTSGKHKRTKWIPRKKTSTSSLSIQIIQRYFGYNKEHAIDALKCFTTDDIIELAQELGYQEKEVQSLKK